MNNERFKDLIPSKDDDVGNLIIHLMLALQSVIDFDQTIFVLIFYDK